MALAAAFNKKSYWWWRRPSVCLAFFILLVCFLIPRDNAWPPAYLVMAMAMTFLLHSYYRSLKIDVTGKAVLVTGCDSGFGHQLARMLHQEHGFPHVFACCLDRDSEGGRALQRMGLDVLTLDVTSQEQVDRALAHVEQQLKEHLLELWAVVNNAGMGTVGFIEWLPMDTYQKITEVNLLGMIRVSKAFMPLIRRSHGRLVNVSSTLGRVSGPFLGAYCITKFGVEALSDCLRLEMWGQFGVRVVTVEPGNYMAATRIIDDPEPIVRRLWEDLPEQLRDDYGGQQCLERQILSGQIAMKIGASDITPVCTAMADAVYRRYPKSRYFEASLVDRSFAYVSQFLPDFLMDPLKALFENQLLHLFQKFIVISDKRYQ
jgi:3-hydroxybutyrate dehydrogenase